MREEAWFVDCTELQVGRVFSGYLPRNWQYAQDEPHQKQLWTLNVWKEAFPCLQGAFLFSDILHDVSDVSPHLMKPRAKVWRANRT